jgi:hypothetical protein
MARLLAAMALIAGLVVTVAAPSQAATPACSGQTLVAWLNAQTGGPAAGSTYYQLRFTNLSSHACTLRGYPGVSAIALNGRQIGSPAGRNAAHATSTVTLAPGDSAAAVLQISQARNFPPASCSLVTAAGLRVYAPGTTQAKTVPFPFAACAKTGPVTLHVQSVQRA